MRDLSLSVREVLASDVRQPRWRVELWDILTPNAASMAWIIEGTIGLPDVNGFDVTAYVADGLTWEAPGDKRADRLSFTLVDYTDRFHPDVGADRRFFEIGQAVRLWEGDASLDEADWVCTFTGHVRGQVGFTEDRQALRYQTSVVAYGRRATPLFLKQKFTSRTYGRRTEYGTICQEIAVSQMHLSGAELERLPTSLGKVTQFAASSIVDLTPLEALDKILETVGQVADFDGEGKLRTYSRDVRRGADKTFPDRNLVFAYSITGQEIEAYNSVSVTGLDKNITEVEQPEQALARATIPVGFWRPSHTVQVQWSEKNDLRARNTRLKVLTSVNDSLALVDGDEDYEEQSEYGGRIRVDLDEFLLSLMAVISIAGTTAAAFPDLVEAIGVGVTNPVGRIAQGVFQLLAYETLAVHSSGQYEVWGVPLVPVYKEITATATRTGVPEALLHQKEMSNDWLNSIPELQEVAVLELYWETAQEKPREILLLNDWSLEIGDIISIPLGGGRKLWVDSLSKSLGREAMPVMRVTGYLVPEGV